MVAKHSALSPTCGPFLSSEGRYATPIADRYFIQDQAANSRQIRTGILMEWLPGRWIEIIKAVDVVNNDQLDGWLGVPRSSANSLGGFRIIFFQQMALLFERPLVSLINRDAPRAYLLGILLVAK